MLAMRQVAKDTYITVADMTIYEHLHLDTVGNDFLEDARVVYGDEGALIIGDAIISGATYAQAVLPLTERYNTKLLLAVMNPPGDHDRGYPVHAWANGHKNQIALMFNPDASVADIAHDLYHAIPHEFAHLAHYQLNPDFGQATLESGRYTFFRAAIREGVARCAEFLDLSSQDIQEQQSMYGKDLTNITNELEALLNASEGGSSKVWELLYGKIEGLVNPYRIGHYVVSRLAMYYDYDLKTLMSVPLEEYVNFAQAELT